MAQCPTDHPMSTAHNMDPFPRSPARFPFNQDNNPQGGPPPPSVDHLVRVKRCAAHLVLNSSSKILQLYGVQLAVLGTSFDPEIGCEYVVYRIEETFSTSPREDASEQQQKQQQSQITAHRVQVSKFAYYYFICEL